MSSGAAVATLLLLLVSTLYLFPEAFKTMVPKQLQTFFANAYFSFTLGSLPYKLHPLNWLYFFSVFYLATYDILVSLLLSLGFVAIISTISAYTRSTEIEKNVIEESDIVVPPGVIPKDNSIAGAEIQAEGQINNSNLFTVTQPGSHPGINPAVGPLAELGFIPVTSQQTGVPTSFAGDPSIGHTNPYVNQ